MDLPARMMDRYQLVRELGRGGYGSVWLAEQRHIGRRVAIKILHPHLADRPHLQRRFRREARVLSRVRNPNVVQVLDFDAGPEGLFLVMEFLEGETLRDRLREELVLPEDEILDVLHALCSGLLATHDAGLVHRDLKPGNIILAELATGEAPVLLDFGLAAPQHDDEDFSALTGAGQLIGTPAYMSPEAARGERGGPPSDLYALGIIAWEMCCGSAPFRADTVLATLRLQELQPLPNLGQHALIPVPAPLRELIEALLAKDPALRPTAADALQRLASLRHSPPQAGPSRPHTDLLPLPASEFGLRGRGDLPPLHSSTRTSALPQADALLADGALSDAPTRSMDISPPGPSPHSVAETHSISLPEVEDGGETTHGTPLGPGVQPSMPSGAAARHPLQDDDQATGGRRPAPLGPGAPPSMPAGAAARHPLQDDDQATGGAPVRRADTTSSPAPGVPSRHRPGRPLRALALLGGALGLMLALGLSASMIPGESARSPDLAASPASAESEGTDGRGGEALPLRGEGAPQLESAPLLHVDSAPSVGTPEGFRSQVLTASREHALPASVDLADAAGGADLTRADPTGPAVGADDNASAGAPLSPAAEEPATALALQGDASRAHGAARSSGEAGVQVDAESSPPSAPRHRRSAQTPSGRGSASGQVPPSAEDRDPDADATPRRSALAATPPAATLAVSALPWGEIYVNGAHIGASPLRAHRLPSGAHEIRIRHGDQEHVERVQLGAGEHRLVRHRFTD